MRLTSSLSTSCRCSQGKAFPSLHHGIVRCRSDSYLCTNFQTALFNFITTYSIRESEASQTPVRKSHFRSALCVEWREQASLTISAVSSRFGAYFTGHSEKSAISLSLNKCRSNQRLAS